MKIKDYFFSIAVLSLPFTAYADEVNPVLASTSKVTIRKNDLTAEMQRIPDNEWANVLSSRERLAQLVETILMAKTLAHRAASEGLDKNPALQAEIDLAREKILARAYTEKFIKDIKLPDFTARAREIYLAEAAEKYTGPERIKVAHILVDVKCRTRDAALERAKEVRAKLDGGANFSDVAKEYSDDPTAKENGGLLKMAYVNQFEENFAKTALKLKPGQLSEPVFTPYGYHIIRLDEYQEKRKFSFEVVKGEIIEDLKNKYINMQRSNHFSPITNDPSIKINEAAMDAQLTKTDGLKTPLPK